MASAMPSRRRQIDASAAASLFVTFEVRPLQAGAVDEQARRLAGQHSLARRVLPHRRQRQRRHPIRQLAIDSQALAAGHEDAKLGSTDAAAGRRAARTPSSKCSALSSTSSNCRDPSHSASVSTRSLPGLLADAERVRHGLADERRIAQRRQLHEPDAIRILVKQRVRHLQRQPGLAAAAGADQRQQARGGQPLLDLRDLSLAADEARQGLGQVVPRLWRSRGRLHPAHHFEGEAVTLAGHRRDRLRAEHLAQRRDMRLQVFSSTTTLPQTLLQQLVLGDEVVALLHQRDQQVEGTRAQGARPDRSRASGARRAAARSAQTGNEPMRWS